MMSLTILLVCIYLKYKIFIQNIKYFCFKIVLILENFIFQINLQKAIFCHLTRLIFFKVFFFSIQWLYIY